MKSIKFGNKKALQIISSKIISKIKNNINNIGTFDITGKYYNFLNKKNINLLSSNKFLFSINTFGKKHLLFLTKITNKKYCIFINKKNGTMIMSRFRFKEDLFNGTLLDGEFVKKSDGNWVYLVSDIAYISGINIITRRFEERYEILKDIFSNKYQDDINISVCLMELKKYFEYKYIKSVCEDYIKSKDYKCSGLLFKNLENFSNNYLYIFIECRSDNKILNNNSNNYDTKQNSSNTEIVKLDREYVYFQVKTN